MKQENIMISIIIISYKQVNYIKDAIDSVLQQKVNFKYELLLADDCSQDGTLEIMREYESKYPAVVKVLVRKKNMGGTNNLFSALSQAKGKYVTFLEGDDYWIDENKIQTQVNFLENNETCIGVAHMLEWRNLKNEVVEYTPRWIKNDHTIDKYEYLKGKYFNFNTLVYRNVFKNTIESKNVEHILKFHSIIGDVQVSFHLLTLGDVHILANPMMVYRWRKDDNETNYNSTHTTIQMHKSLIDIYTKMDEFYNGRYSFYKKILNAVTVGFTLNIIKFKIKEAFNFIKICPKKYKVIVILGIPFWIIKLVISKISSLIKFKMIIKKKYRGVKK